MVKINFVSMSKPKVPSNMINVKPSGLTDYLKKTEK